ncbi:MAG: hypothetical protein NT013_29845 [Planctomycetia bacterium]|nr:hypothetical protein [Planctomycetia bacterium]
MIRGRVARHEGIVRLSVFGRAGHRETIEAMPLVGMQLLEGFELTMQVRQDGPVLIKRMKPLSGTRRR